MSRSVVIIPSSSTSFVVAVFLVVVAQLLVEPGLLLVLLAACRDYHHHTRPQNFPAVAEGDTNGSLNSGIPYDEARVHMGGVDDPGANFSIHPYRV